MKEDLDLHGNRLNYINAACMVSTGKSSGSDRVVDPAHYR